MQQGILRSPGLWLFLVIFGLALTIFAMNFKNTLFFLLGYILLILSVMAIFLLILKDMFFKYVTDNIDKGVLLCFYAAIIGMIPEVINYWTVSDSLHFKITTVPFTVFMLAAAGAGGSILATGMTIEARKPTPKESALNTKKIRDRKRISK